MKIALLSVTVDGIYRSLRELAQTLIEEGHQVIVIAPFDESNKYLEQIGCKLIDIYISAHGTSVVEDYKLFLSYKKILKEQKIDIAFTYTIKPDIWGARACYRCKIPFFSTINGIGDSLYNPGPIQKLVIGLCRFSLKHSQKVFFQNSFNRDMFIKSKITTLDKSVIVPGSGINLSEHPLESYPSHNSIKFINIGRLSKDKGVRELIEAIKIINSKYENTEFTIVGNCKEEFIDDLKELDKDERVHYLGRVPYTQIHNLIKESDAIVLPSYHEGIANVLLESSSCGIAVIATNAEGCIETFDEGITGFGFEKQDVNSFVNAIEKFINLSKEEKVQMGLNGRKKIEREFTRELVLNKYIDEMNKFMGKK